MAGVEVQPPSILQCPSVDSFVISSSSLSFVALVFTVLSDIICQRTSLSILTFKNLYYDSLITLLYMQPMSNQLHLSRVKLLR